MKANCSPLRWVPSLYFAMGLPFVTLNMVATVMLKDLEVDDARITFWTSLIMLPWTVKFLWSPLLETHGTKKFFVTATQILSGVLFGLVALSLGLESFFAVAIALMAVIAMSGATHDIAADGVYMSALSTQDQARWVGWQGAFYNLAKLLATGGLVWASGRLALHYSPTLGVEGFRPAWTIIMLIIGAIMLLCGLWHTRVLPSPKSEPQSNQDNFMEVLVSFFRKPHIWFYITFIILYRLAEGFVMKIVPLFLKAETAAGGLGLSNESIGILYGTCGSFAFLLGSFLAGYYIAHFGLKKTLFSLCCIFNIPFIAYALLAWYQPQSLYLVGGAIMVEYFGYGFGFVGLTLFMMQQVAPGRFRMAHYAFASGIMNLSVMVTGMPSGWLATQLGYKYFFIAVLIAAIPAFIVTRIIPFTHPDRTPEQNQ